MTPPKPGPHEGGTGDPSQRTSQPAGEPAPAQPPGTRPGERRFREPGKGGAFFAPGAQRLYPCRATDRRYNLPEAGRCRAERTRYLMGGLGGEGGDDRDGGS